MVSAVKAQLLLAEVGSQFMPCRFHVAEAVDFVPGHAAQVGFE